LVRKLKAHGIRGKIIDWIESWLSNRRQRVCVDGEHSDWEKVSSGVPQGSVLGPVLFIVYINDLDQGILSKLGKFADDSKLCKGIGSEDDVKLLANDLAQLDKWSQDWQMKFNAEKCSVIHLGKSNSQHQYTLGNVTLKNSERERDLGVIVDKTLKFSEHVNSAVGSANATLGMIRRNITCKRKYIIIRLYKALVRPKLEFCVQMWRPYLKKDIDKLERVQHRATKMIEECKGLDYYHRLKVTGLMSLEERRIRGDMIEVFKTLKGLNKIDSNSLLKLANCSRTRGHKFKLVKFRSRLDIRKNFFSQRVATVWNNLPEVVVEADSVNSFKNRYDKFVKGYC
jgi:ribonuclease P/MRP protein subunit RPP40